MDPQRLAEIKAKLLDECDKPSIGSAFLTLEQGSTQAQLEQALPGVSLEELALTLNVALKENRLTVLANAKDSFYKTVPLDEFEKLKGLTPEQLVVYRLVEQVQREGIWAKHLRAKSSLPQPSFLKAIKVLESKKLIKAFKSVTAKNKRYYIQYNLEPASQHIGDIWYNADLDFDSEFVEVITRQCYQFIQHKGYASLEDLQLHITQSGISTIEIKKEHIQKLVDTLEYDGKVEAFIPTARKSPLGDGTLYRPTRIRVPENGLTATPCGICPVFELCSDDGEISPAKCIYIGEWLEF